MNIMILGVRKSTIYHLDNFKRVNVRILPKPKHNEFDDMGLP